MSMIHAYGGTSVYNIYMETNILQIIYSREPQI